MAAPSVVHTGLDFGEGPRWRAGRLWYSDFYRHAVFSIGPDGEDARVEVDLDDEQPSGLGWLPDGTLLVVAMQARQVLAVDAGGEVRVHADLSGVATGMANDMVVSADGHAYVGNVGFDLIGRAEPAPANLAHVMPDGEVRRVAHPLACPNGSVITPDGRTLIVGETLGGRYTAFTLDEEGHPVTPRVWAAVEGSMPDGCCLDADGAVWMADLPGRRFARVHADGAVSHEIPVDGAAVACALGGPERRTLYGFVSPGAYPEDVAGKGLSSIVAIDVEVPAAGQP